VHDFYCALKYELTVS